MVYKIYPFCKAAEQESKRKVNQGEESVLIVDEQNHVVAQVSRRLMREGRLSHRASYILVFNRNREIFVQKRTMSKDIYPGYLDVAAGGVVMAGESYEESARRELAEELGIARASLKCHGDFYHETGSNRVWGRVFACTKEGPFVLQPEEVAAGFFIGLDEIRVLSKQENFTPDGLIALQMVLDHARIF